jgi:hypothetical protein
MHVLADVSGLNPDKGESYKRDTDTVSGKWHAEFVRRNVVDLVEGSSGLEKEHPQVPHCSARCHLLSSYKL